MTTLPSLNGLRAFDAAGRRLSFRAAADEMGVTQGAVAQQVRQLESELGVTLFDRVPTGLALTAVGRTYHERVADAFADLRTATSQIKPEPGKVLISVTPTFASKWLIPNLPDFSDKHPNIDLRILATEKVSSFHSDGIDLAIRQGAPPFGASLSAALLFKQDIVAVLSPKLARQRNDPINAHDLSKLPKIRDSHDLWPRVLAQLGCKDLEKRGLRLSQTALAVDAAVSGQGVALVSRFLVASEIEAGRLLEVKLSSVPVSQDFYLLTLRKTSKNRDLASVVTWLKSRAHAVGNDGGFDAGASVEDI